MRKILRLVILSAVHLLFTALCDLKNLLVAMAGLDDDWVEPFNMEFCEWPNEDGGSTQILIKLPEGYCRWYKNPSHGD